MFLYGVHVLHVCEYMCTGIIPNHSSTLFIETGVLVKLTDVARHMRSGDTISTSRLELQVTTGPPHHVTFTYVLGIQTPVFTEPSSQSCGFFF